MGDYNKGYTFRGNIVLLAESWARAMCNTEISVITPIHAYLTKRDPKMES